MMTEKSHELRPLRGFVFKARPTLFVSILFVLAVLLLTTQRSAAQTEETLPAQTPSTTELPRLHPTFPLLDENGENVLDTDQPVSTMNTCGACHDTDFIASHSFHSDAGLSTFAAPGTVVGGQVWDMSAGIFGRWNPLTYRTLSPVGDAIFDLTTADWVKLLGARHVGGGPAEYSRAGELLTLLTPDATNPETSTIDPATGQPLPWDWAASGVVEMNCFLCHTPAPNNEARIAALAAGAFRWANTATLDGSGLVEQVDGQWQWQREAFDEEGNVRLDIQDPGNNNCGQCHGLVHTNNQIPLTLDGGGWRTETTGQVISPQRIADSGLNLSDKEALSRSWDIHAERVVACVECHYALNNPIYYEETDESRPAHLIFDPRRIDFSEYLYRPLHQFAKGQSAQSAIAPELDNTLRRCESCHSIEATHNWLPYKERHTSAVSCESCHIPELYAPAVQSIDWTVLLPDGSPNMTYRGLAADGEIITGFAPTLLTQQNADGGKSLAPFNLITAWYWVYGDPARPVPARSLEAAWLDGGQYQADVLATFDDNGDGQLDEAERLIDTPDKEVLIATRLAAQGLENPRINGNIQPYSINHDVAAESWAIRDCRTCHGESSRITATTVLANGVPGGVMPAFPTSNQTSWSGKFITNDAGQLLYQPQTKAENLYILGHDSVFWVDWAGILIFLGTFAGVITHGGLRFFALRRQNMHSQPALREVYMYSIYERLWHWLQTIVIFGLIFTGLVIHKPDKFGIFSFNYVVQVHNVLAAILLINAALSAFYHLASGEIRQFLPRPYGFFDQMIVQAKYYLGGIFRGEPHPFDKTRDRKLNPLQQVTYFGILNVLLPLQVITGALMWGAQRWPNAADALGGLPFLAPFHTIIAWLFASFIVLHVYLTTTGHTPLAGIKSMIMGWDEVEIHTPSQEAATPS